MTLTGYKTADAVGALEEVLKQFSHVEKNSWRGNHDGVRAEIVEWHYGDDDIYSSPQWCYYILVYEGQVPPTNWPRYWIDGKEPDKFGRVWYPLHETFFYDLDWPGGSECSYYEKFIGEHAHAGRVRNSIKFGCAYMCEGWSPISVEDALRDVARTIKSLREVEPDLKYICDYCGGFFHGHEGHSLGAGWYCEEHHLTVSMAREGIADVD